LVAVQAIFSLNGSACRERFEPWLLGLPALDAEAELFSPWNRIGAMRPVDSFAPDFSGLVFQL
jgi:hypothetical protein